MTRRRRQRPVVGGAFGGKRSSHFEALDKTEREDIAAFASNLAPGETLRDRLLRLEVEAEFRVASSPCWEAIANAVWQQMQRTKVAWAEHAKWHRSTQIYREKRRAHAEQLKAITVAVRGCTNCGRPFAVTAYDVKRSTGKVCSNACRSASRHNIRLHVVDGEALPISEWAKRFGLRRTTVEQRIASGWSLKKALKTPLHATRRKLSPELEAEIVAATSGVRELCRRLGVDYRTAKRIRQRAKRLDVADAAEQRKKHVVSV